MNETTKTAGRGSDGLIHTFCAALYGFLSYTYVYNILSIDQLSDYRAHTYTILALFQSENPLDGWMAAPHCLWHLTVLFLFRVLHIPVEAAAAFSTGLYSLFYYAVLLWVIRRVTEHIGSALSAACSNLIALSFCFVQSLYFYWLDTGNRYLGVFSPNPLHNPTLMCARGFVLLIFFLTVDLLSCGADKDHQPVFFPVRQDPRRYYLLLALFLFLSTLMKPTFAEMFIPTVAFFMLGMWIVKLIRKDEPKTYFRQCTAMLLCALPSLLYILIQYIVFFFWEGSIGSEGGMIFTRFLEVWSLYSDNILLSILLGMAFPIYILLLDLRFFLKNIAGRLALIGYGTAFLEAAFLGESGERMTHGNFLWPLMSGMQLMWTVALLRLLVLERKQEYTGFKRGMLLFGWFLFFCHLFCGLVFYHLELQGM